MHLLECTATTTSPRPMNSDQTFGVLMDRLPFPNGQVSECIFHPQAVTTLFDIIHQNTFKFPPFLRSTYHSRSSFFIDE
jgi:hypothetical protein